MYIDCNSLLHRFRELLDDETARFAFKGIYIVKLCDLANKVGIVADFVNDGKDEADEIKIRLHELTELAIDLKGEANKRGLSHFADNCNLIISAASKVNWNTPEPQQQTIEGNDGELTGNGNEVQPEPTAKPVVKEQLPTIYDDEVNKAKEQHVFYNAITSKNKWMTINADGYSYTWNKKKKYLAYLCGRLYWGDKVCLDKVAMKQSGEGYEIFKLDKSTESLEESDELCNLFGGIDVSNNRSQLKEPPDKWREIDKLFE